MKINAYAAKEAKSNLEPFEYEAKELGDYDVEVKITHCGICHSDIHLIDGDWGDYFPVVPGHEIIGELTAKGEKANFEIGERVGIGWQRSSCMECELCKQGDENLCKKQEAICQGNFGGYADKIRTDSRFVFSIPEKLESETVAPLLCGGITVYLPLRKFTKSGMRVGVIGVGGLGHLAIQLAKAKGCEVIAFSRSSDKEEAAKEFGAKEFILENENLEKLNDSIDLIISTVTGEIDYQKYIKLLKTNGVFCQVGAAPGTIEIPILEAIISQKSITGSLIGSPEAIKEMLELAAEKNVKAKVEVMPITEVNEAVKRVRDNKARYRIVLKN